MLINFDHIKTFYNALTQKLKNNRGNWEQNDSTAEDYIKNRPFYEETIVTGESVNITWDGNTEGLLAVQLDEYFAFYKVSDLVFSDEQIKNMKVNVYNIESGTPSYHEMIYADEWDNMINEGSITPDIVNGYEIQFVRKAGAQLFGITYPEEGVYFFKESTEDFLGYPTALTAPEQTKTIIHKLDSKYIDLPNVDIPDNVVTEDNINQILNNNLAPVAFTNNYNSLSGKPVVYTDVVRHSAAQSLNDDQKQMARDNIGAVNNYDDLENKPVENDTVKLNTVNEITWDGNTDLVSMEVNGISYYRVFNTHIAKDLMNEITQSVFRDDGSIGGWATYDATLIASSCGTSENGNVAFYPDIFISVNKKGTYAITVNSNNYTINAPMGGVYFAYDTRNTRFTSKLSWSEKGKAVKFSTPYIVLPSATEDSDKQFKVTIDDNGTVTASSDDMNVTMAKVDEIPTKVSELENDAEYITADALSGLGGGDMLKTTYDTNNNGKVDVAENAEKLGEIAADEYVRTEYHQGDDITDKTVFIVCQKEFTGSEEETDTFEVARFSDEDYITIEPYSNNQTYMGHGVWSDMSPDPIYDDSYFDVKCYKGTGAIALLDENYVKVFSTLPKEAFIPSSNGIANQAYYASKAKDADQLGGTYANYYAKKTDIPSALKNPNALTFGAKTYDGSKAETISAADLGLSGAMRFLGTTTTVIFDGSSTGTVSIGGSNITAASGNVVLYNGSEYVWDGAQWEELGSEGSFKLKQTAVTSPAASGNATAFIDTIAQDENGVVTATKKNITKADLGLGNVDNTADANKSVKYASTAVKATQDASGNVITTTYATKTEVTNAIASAITTALNTAV